MQKSDANQTTAADAELGMILASGAYEIGKRADAIAKALANAHEEGRRQAFEAVVKWVRTMKL